MLSTGSLKDAQLLASSDSDIFALVAANGRAKDKNKDGLGLLLYKNKIVECARMALFHPCAFDDPRGRFFVRAKPELCNNGGLDMSGRE